MAADHSYHALQANLDHVFRDPEVLQRALTHTSAGAGFDNERLEFLGDRVLGLAVSEMLLDAFPEEDEGHIGRRFAALVRAETLTRIGRAVGIGDALILPGTTANDGMLADATEAVIAALYLDGGYAVAARFIDRHWSPLIKTSEAPPRDAKTALQEWSQAQGIGLPKYHDISREGPDHAPVFTVEVTVAGKDSARAEGSSKRAAEQEAAGQLLAHLGVTDAA